MLYTIAIKFDQAPDSESVEFYTDDSDAAVAQVGDRVTYTPLGGNLDVDGVVSSVSKMDYPISRTAAFVDARHHPDNTGTLSVYNIAYDPTPQVRGFCILGGRAMMWAY